ncbi:hypothetical protein [Parafrankia discariae]|uniref:hypothetical protein n=1 Tax=Parafrankia discariae TaxID=365528 RepID=UPI000399DA29|nr:hypothetical protein [Parafrankia discariae]
MDVRNSGSERSERSERVRGTRAVRSRTWRSGPATAGRGGLALAAVALVVASCQSGGDGTAGIVPAVTSAPPGPSQAPVVSRTSAGPALRAEDYVLTEGAVTAGFTASPADPESNSDDLTMVQVAQCLGVPAEQFSDEHLDTADGPDFTNDVDELVTISSSAEIVSEAKVASDLEILKNPRFAECFGRAIQAEFDADSGSGAKVEIVAAESPPPPAGANALLRISMGVTAGGETVGLVLDNVFFFEGQVEVIVNYSNVDNAPSGDHLQRITDQISGKLQNQ